MIFSKLVNTICDLQWTTFYNNIMVETKKDIFSKFKDIKTKRKKLEWPKLKFIL